MKHGMALGYGSKWHLLRYLGYHRDEMNRQLEEQAGVRTLTWLDFRFDCRLPLKDGEWRGVDFLPKDEPARSAWAGFWPQTGNVPNWDAVALAQPGGRNEWVLVEAKAHLEELQTECKANERGGLGKIRAAFGETMAAFGARVPVENWLSPYYQYCNRLAALHFLTKFRVPARLVFIYFLGDTFRGKTCPSDKSAWETALAEVHRHIGVAVASGMESQVGQVFLRVCP